MTNENLKNRSIKRRAIFQTQMDSDKAKNLFVIFAINKIHLLWLQNIKVVKKVKFNGVTNN